MPERPTLLVEAPGPHHGQPVLSAGAPLPGAEAALIAVHGRGAQARDILALARELGGDAWAYLAPQAKDDSWYPLSFLAPMERNEPWLGSALGALEDLVGKVTEHLPVERTVLVGFSQGACLMLEYAARTTRPYGGLVGLSGGLIGPPGTPRAYRGSLDGVRVFLGCSDVDPHIPLERVHETDEVLTRMGAAVTTRIYPGLGHTVNDDEIAHARELAAAVQA